jgi:hypothetical protein
MFARSASRGACIAAAGLGVPDEATDTCLAGATIDPHGVAVFAI